VHINHLHIVNLPICTSKKGIDSRSTPLEDGNGSAD